MVCRGCGCDHQSRALSIASLWMISTTLVNASLTSGEKKEILSAHNYFRGQVDPIATNMQRLDWDDELAKIAEHWASKCLYGFDEYRDFRSSEFDYVGEVLANSTNGYTNYTELISGWFYLEKRYNYYRGYCLNYDGTRSADGEDCSPYQQLVWAKTYAVGCGAMRCKYLFAREKVVQNALYFVCNYGPGGGFEGVQPYASGYKVCSSCPERKPNCVRRLCSRSSAASFIKDALTHWIAFSFYMLHFALL